jgi:hypothetical protein
MDDQRTDRAGGGSVMTRVLKWLAVAAWTVTLGAFCVGTLHHGYSNDPIRLNAVALFYLSLLFALCLTGLSIFAHIVRRKK